MQGDPEDDAAVEAPAGFAAGSDGDPGAGGGRSNACAILSERVETLVLLSVLLQVAFVLSVGVLQIVPDALAGLGGIVLIVVVAAWLYVTNYRLVRCGPQAVRFEAAPRFVNRPGLAVRLAFHVTINWLPLATILLWARSLQDIAMARAAAAAVVALTVTVWIAFNVMHRRMNRLRNLVLSSTFAIALLAVAVSLL